MRQEERRDSPVFKFWVCTGLVGGVYASANDQVIVAGFVGDRNVQFFYKPFSATPVAIHGMETFPLCLE